MRKRWIPLAAGFAALLVPASAWAHASLVRTDPSNGAVLAHSPALGRRSRSTTRCARGRELRRFATAAALSSQGTAHVVGAKTLVIPLRRGLANGDYSVRWSIFSDDGHLESGVLAFGVGAGRRAADRRSGGRGDRPEHRECRCSLALLRRCARCRGHGALHVRRPSARRGAHPADRLDGRRAGRPRRGAGDPSRRSLHSRRQGARRRVRHRARRRDARAPRRRSIGVRCGRPYAPRFRSPLSRRSPATRSTGVFRASTSSSTCCTSSSASGWVGVLIGVAVVRGADLRRAGALALASVVAARRHRRHARGVRADRALAALGHLVRSRVAPQDRPAVRRARARLAAPQPPAAARRRGARCSSRRSSSRSPSSSSSGPDGTSSPRSPRVAHSSQPSAPPPPPPAGAVVLAREAGHLGVASRWSRSASPPSSCRRRAEG